MSMRTSLRICWGALLLSSIVHAQKTTVVTVAGGYQGNHKPVLSASFAFPTAVAFDSSGILYIADSANCEIRKVSKQGSIEVFAGSGFCGFSGDGGKATSAMLSASIGGMVFDSSGNLVVADTDNLRIRKITPDRTISTIAGNGTYGYSGDRGNATQAQLGSPRGIALDPAGNLYIADSNNFVVREVNSAGIIQTVAGNHSNGYSGDGGPATAAQLGLVQGIAVDASGNLYLGDGMQHVRQVDSAGTITTIAGNGFGGNTGDGGPGPSAAIGGPTALFAGGNGTLFIATSSSIWWLDLSTDTIHLLGGAAPSIGFGGDGGLALPALFNQPGGMVMDSQGNLLLADSGNNRVREIAAGGQLVTTIAGGYIGDGHQGTDASLNFGSQGDRLTFDSSGNLYIADTSNDRIRKVSPKGIITTVAGVGTTGYSGDGGPATAAQLSHPGAVAADSLGNLFIADTGNGVVRKVDSSGTITTLVVQSNNPIYPFRLYNAGASLAVDSAGNLYVSDSLCVIWKINSNGDGTIVAGTAWGFGYGGDGGPATQALLFIPAGVAVDAAGNLYIADWLNERIRKVDTNGVITTVAGNGTQAFSGDGGPATAASLSLPQDVTTDSSGLLYIADWINFRIRVVDSAGVINTVVGSGGLGYNGERLSPDQINVLPIALAFNPAGQLYFADSSSYRVRKVGK